MVSDASENLLKAYNETASALEATPVPAKPSNPHFGVGPIMKLLARNSVEFAEREFEFKTWLKDTFNVEVHDLEQIMHRHPKSVEITTAFLKQVHKYFEYGENNTMGIGLGGGHAAFTMLSGALLHPEMDVYIDTPKPGGPNAGVGAFRNSWAGQLWDRFDKALGGPYTDKLHYGEKEGVVPSVAELEKMNIKTFVGVGNETTGATTYNEQDIRNLLEWVKKKPEERHVILDATSLMGAVNLPKDLYHEVMEKCCVFTPAQKAIGGEAGLALISLTPEARKQVDENQKNPKWSIPTEYQIAKIDPSGKGGERSVSFGPFFDNEQDKMIGGVINTTPTRDLAYSLFAVKKMQDLIGDVHTQNERSIKNLKAAEAWFDKPENKLFSLSVDDESRRSASVMLFKVNDKDVDEATKNAIVVRSKAWLDKEGRADNINAFPGTPGDYRGWIGGVRETSDVVALLDNIKYAYTKAKKEILEEKLIGEGLVAGPHAAEVPAAIPGGGNAPVGVTRVLVAEQMSLKALRETAEKETAAGRPTFVHEDMSGIKNEANGVHYYYQPQLGPDEIKALCSEGEFRGVMMRPKKILEETNAEIFLRVGTGTDNLNLVKQEKGKIVMNTPGQNAHATSEYAVKALFQQLAPTRFEEATKGVLENTLTSLDLGAHFTGELKDKTVLVAGMGDIGILVAQKLKALGVNVVGVGYTREDGTQSFTKDDAEMLGISHANTVAEAMKNYPVDALTIHTPGKADKLISAEVFEAVNKDRPITIVNAARANVIDTSALNQAIKDGKVKGFTVDVDYFPGETRDQMGPYRDIAIEHKGKGNFIMTPHFGGDVTRETNDNATAFAMEQMNKAVFESKIQNKISGDLGSKYEDIGVKKPNGVGRITAVELKSILSSSPELSKAGNLVAAMFRGGAELTEKFGEFVKAYSMITNHPRLAGRLFENKAIAVASGGR